MSGAPALQLVPAQTVLARVDAAPGKGRGVFAVADIPAGAVILTDATIPLSAADCTAVVGTPVDDYYFAHPRDPARGLVVLGLSSLANHADDPTAATEFAYDRALGWLVTLRALRPLAPGDEITRRYACPPWFSVQR